MANRPDGTIYTGVTADLLRRVWQHKQGLMPGLCKKYNLHRLDYYELMDDMYAAIAREKQIKAGPRRNKVALIEQTNPDWSDLYRDIAG